MTSTNHVKTPSAQIIKSKKGIIIGFVLGVTGFLLLFKIIVLDHTPPSDELAPGIVLFAAMVSGLFFAFVGYRLQKYFMKKV